MLNFRVTYKKGTTKTKFMECRQADEGDAIKQALTHFQLPDTKANRKHLTVEKIRSFI